MEKRPLHWSERAKMFPGSAGAGTGQSQTPRPPKNQKNAPENPSDKEPKKGSSHKGFLITLLVILLVTAAAVVVLFWYLPNRDSGGDDSQQATATTGSESTDAGAGATDQPTQTTITGAVADAKDIEAMTLVRDSMVAVESAYANVGTFEPASLTASLLGQMDPSLTFVIRDSDQAAKAPVSSAGEMALDFYGDANSYALGTRSDSGAFFGVIVNKGNSTTTYYVNGQEEDWSTRLTESVVG